MSAWLRNGHGNTVVVLMEGQEEQSETAFDVFSQGQWNVALPSSSSLFFVVPFPCLNDSVCSLSYPWKSYFTSLSFNDIIWINRNNTPSIPGLF